MYRDHTYVQLTMIRILVAKAIAILRHSSTNRYKLQYQIVSTEKDTGSSLRLTTIEYRIYSIFIT